MRFSRYLNETIAVVRELLVSRSAFTAALLILPYAGVLIGLDVAGHYGAITHADLPVQFNLASDGGFGEWLEYSLTASVAIMLILIWRSDRDWTYLANALLFLWLTLDNSAEIHEQTGQWLAPILDAIPGLPIAGQDIGEAFLFLLIGVVWLAGLGLSLKNAQIRPALYSLLLACCIAMAAIFGVIVDILVAAGTYTPAQLEIVTFIEDGGEFAMICISFIVMVAIFDTERKHQAANPRSQPIGNRHSALIQSPLYHSARQL